MSMESIAVILFLSAGGLIAWQTGKLTAIASITGIICGLLIHTASGIAGVCLLTAFFAGGTIVTRWRSDEKQRAGLAEKSHEMRKPGQVLANAGVAAALGLVSLLCKDLPYTLMIAVAFSSAAADTFSSELGNVYGRNFFNILTWKKDQKGLDGVISLEGTIAGIGGSLLIAAIYWMFTRSVNGFYIVMIAGTIGNLADSILGATLERKKWIGNDVVNFGNTAFAVLVAYLLFLVR